MTQRTRFLTLCASLLIVGAPQWAAGQEAKPAAKPEAKAEAKVEAKQPAKARGYLPPHYNEVINKQQREQIYAIQDKYDDKIEALQKQLKELLGQRNTEVEAVLTPDQKKLVAEYAALAKVKAQNIKNAKTPPATDKAPEKPAAANAKAAPAEAPKKP